MGMLVDIECDRTNCKHYDKCAVVTSDNTDFQPKLEIKSNGTYYVNCEDEKNVRTFGQGGQRFGEGL